MTLPVLFPVLYRACAAVAVLTALPNARGVSAACDREDLYQLGENAVTYVAIIRSSVERARDSCLIAEIPSPTLP